MPALYESLLADHSTHLYRNDLKTKKLPFNNVLTAEFAGSQMYPKLSFHLHKEAYAHVSHSASGIAVVQHIMHHAAQEVTQLTTSKTGWKASEVHLGIRVYFPIIQGKPQSALWDCSGLKPTKLMVQIQVA